MSRETSVSSHNTPSVLPLKCQLSWLVSSPAGDLSGPTLPRKCLLTSARFWPGSCSQQGLRLWRGGDLHVFTTTTHYFSTPFKCTIRIMKGCSVYPEDSGASALQVTHRIKRTCFPSRRRPARPENYWLRTLRARDHHSWRVAVAFTLDHNRRRLSSCVVPAPAATTHLNVPLHPALLARH